MMSVGCRTVKYVQSTGDHIGHYDFWQSKDQAPHIKLYIFLHDFGDPKRSFHEEQGI